jgi:glycosyltransferase involved in cell wall biosynthesis
MPKTLYVVTQFYPPDYAPTGQFIEELVTVMGKQGQRVKVFTGQPGYAFQKKFAPLVEDSNGVFVRRTRAAQLWPQRIRGKLVNGILFWVRAGLHLLKNTRKGDTLLLTSAPPFLQVLGYLLNSLFGISYVCLIYDLYPDVAVRLGVVSPKNRLVKLWNVINRVTWKNARQIIVLSSTMKERVLAKYPEMIDKVSIIHSWADPNRIIPIDKSDNWFAKKYNLTQKFTILYSGNMGRCHDMDTILQAALDLQDEPIQFVFIGDGAQLQYCTEKVQAWGLENCLFLPYQAVEMLPYSLTACDLSLVSIKRGLEGTIAPSKFYGILASGRPVAAICERQSYLRQIISNSNCGKAFENGDVFGLSEFIRELASDTELAKRMGQSGRSYLMSNFTLEIIAQKYSRVLNLPSYENIQQENLALSKNARSIGQEPSSLRPIGQFLQGLGLLSEAQVLEILQYQDTEYKHLRFGEVAILKGWLQRESLDFVLTILAELRNQPSSTREPRETPISSYRHART